MAWEYPTTDVDWHEWKAMGLRLYASSEGRVQAVRSLVARSQTSTSRDKTLEALGADHRLAAGPHRRRSDFQDGARARLGATAARIHAEHHRRDEQTSPSPARHRLASTSTHSGNGPSHGTPGQASAAEMVHDPYRPPVEAMRVDTGIGKTEAAISSFAALRAARVGLTSDAAGHAHGVLTKRPLIYTVDRHLLGRQDRERFTALGHARQEFRGRGADDPDNPGQEMCLATRGRGAGGEDPADINKTCCRKGREGVPAVRPGAATSGRSRATKPEVWITAHDMLFHAQKVFGKPAAVIIDEGMWQKGIRGIERRGERDRVEVPLDSLITDKPMTPTRPARPARELSQPAGAGA